MPAGDAHDYPIYGANYRVYYPIFDATGSIVTGASGLDAERSLDGGSFADCSNAEVEVGRGWYYQDLTGAEMTAKSVAVWVGTSTTGAKPAMFTLYPIRLPVLESGTAQAGASSTITLASGASAEDSFYNGLFVLCTNNSPSGVQYQARRIISYVGSTRVAAVDAAWSTNPSSATTYDLLIPVGYSTTAWAGRRVNPLVSGRVDASVGAMASGVVTDSALAASAVSEVQSGLATAAGVDAAEAAILAAIEVALSDTSRPAPTAPPAFNAPLTEKISWLYALTRHVRIQDVDGTEALRNAADDGDIATRTNTDNGTQAVKGAWS